MTEFDVREWNLKVDLLCAGEEIDLTVTPDEYAASLLFATAMAERTAQQHPDLFRTNEMTRKRLSNWVKQFSQYENFVEGCWLLMRYYDTEDPLKHDDWTLVELHRRWASLVNLSMYYGNAHQINNFVPFAQNMVDKIVKEMLHRKSRCVDKAKHHRPQAWRLDAKQVKADIDMTKVFRSYFPNMESTGKNYKAFCKWHLDDPRRKPNLVIFPEIGACKCYRCGAAFDVFGMIMDLEKVDFATSVAIAKELG